ncbi:MAG: signal peptidase I [Clostridiaceae bacterium]|nr:signal peptidase I [Clostridiaceae bacterium]
MQQTIQNAENTEKNEKKSIIKVILNFLSNVLLVALSLLIIYMLVFMFRGVKSNETPTIFNHQIYIVKSDSMSPTFRTGSLLIIRLVEKEKIKVNDIITYRRPNDSVATTHRVVRILDEDGERKFITRGDANNIDDPVPVSEDHVVGTVSVAIPLLGYFIGFVRTKQGLLIVVVIPALIIMLTQIIGLIKKESEKEKEKEKEKMPTIEELLEKADELLRDDPGQEDQQ